MKYVIKPYEGVNDYKFGSHLEEILSKAEKDFKKVDKGLLVKLYSDDLSLVFENSRLVEISVVENKGVELYYNEYNLFCSKNIIDKLKGSFSCIQKYGFTIFNSVGIAFSEFQEDEGERTVTIYSPHYWDEIIN